MDNDAENRDGEDVILTAKTNSSFNLGDVLLGSDRRKSTSGWTERGFLSNCLMFLLLLIGILVRCLEPEGSSQSIGHYILGCGLFGFSGGITNWIAVKMLFERVGVKPYYLPGSGVIPDRHIEIRNAIKSMIMKMFFSKEFLEEYMNNRFTELMTEKNLGDIVRKQVSQPGFDALFEAKLEAISKTPDGMILNTIAPLFGGVAPMVPILKPFIGAFGSEIVNDIARNCEVTDLVSTEDVIREVENLLNEKLVMITPEMVRELMEEIIRDHLGWLVVWGNVFGAVIGMASVLAGYGA